MTISKSSLFYAGLFRKYNFVVSQLKHLTTKTSSLGISKIWSTIFLPSKIDEDISKFVQILVNKKFTVKMLNIFVSFKDTKKVDHILEG